MDVTAAVSYNFLQHSHKCHYRDHLKKLINELVFNRLIITDYDEILNFFFF